MEKNNIISEWLDKYSDPEIEESVKSRLKYDVLDHLEKQKEMLEQQKKDIIEQIRKIRQGDMLEEAAENIGKWYEHDNCLFKILYVDEEEKEVKAFFSKNWDGNPSFEIDTVYEHEWKDRKPTDINNERLQKRIAKLMDYLK